MLLKGSFFGSWGLSLFVLFEHRTLELEVDNCSWGLSLFVLFEQYVAVGARIHSSWGLSLFVLFELVNTDFAKTPVLED